MPARRRAPRRRQVPRARLQMGWSRAKLAQLPARARAPVVLRRSPEQRVARKAASAERVGTAVKLSVVAAAAVVPLVVLSGAVRRVELAAVRRAVVRRAEEELQLELELELAVPPRRRARAVRGRARR